jgi:hypothetical protein
VGWASGVVGVITAGVLACGLAACGASGASAHLPSAAQAGPTGVPVRVQPNVVGWSGMMQRPDHIYVGMGGAPIVRQLTWRNWGGAQAWATGQLDIYLPQPGPISGWHPTTYPVRVRLQDIMTRDGQPAYRKMTDFYVNRRGVTHVLNFTFSVLHGGSVPAWNGPGGTFPHQKSPGLA